jgi:hypothetical protein
VSRRGALAGASAALGAGLLAGCAGRDAAAGPSPTASPTPTQTPGATADPDVRLAAQALAAEERQVALVDTVAGRFPALAGRLRGTRVVHERHVAVLTDASPDPAASPTARPAPASRPVPVPGSPAAALRVVVDAEQVLTGRHRDWAVAAASGRLARMLAGMAAASAQQAAVLGGAAGPGGPG